MLLRFLHLLGMTLWMGGAFAGMTLALGARAEPIPVRAGVFRLLARVHGMIVGTGVILTLGSGLLMTMTLESTGDLGHPGVMVMQAAGLLAGILVLFVAIPTSVKIAGLAVPSETGEFPPALNRLRKRQMVVSSVAGVLGIVSLAAVELWK